MTTPLVTCREVRKGYRRAGGGEFQLYCPELEVHPGELVAVVGRSGSGKSTLVQILGLLQRPDSGTVRVLDTDALALGGAAAADFRAAHLGMVFQAFNLLPQLSVLHNVALAAPGGLRAGAGRARELLEAVGLAHYARSRPDHLSGGEQQRVAVARALLNRPEVLLADEPTGNLDEANERMVLHLLRAHADTGNAVVLVTHSRELASSADRVVVLHAGTVVTSPDPAHPRSPEPLQSEDVWREVSR